MNKATLSCPGFISGAEMTGQDRGAAGRVPEINEAINQMVLEEWGPPPPDQVPWEIPPDLVFQSDHSDSATEETDKDSPSEPDDWITQLTSNSEVGKDDKDPYVRIAEAELRFKEHLSVLSNQFDIVHELAGLRNLKLRNLEKDLEFANVKIENLKNEIANLHSEIAMLHFKVAEAYNVSPPPDLGNLF